MVLFKIVVVSGVSALGKMAFLILIVKGRQFNHIFKLKKLQILFFKATVHLGLYSYRSVNRINQVSTKFD